jgi:hypothetical protein
VCEYKFLQTNGASRCHPSYPVHSLTTISVGWIVRDDPIAPDVQTILAADNVLSILRRSVHHFAGIEPGPSLAAKFTGYVIGSAEPRQFTIGIRLQMFSPIFTAINLTNFSPTHFSGALNGEEEKVNGRLVNDSLATSKERIN